MESALQNSIIRDKDLSRLEQLQKAFEKMGVSKGYWHQRFSGKRISAPFAWILKSPVLLASVFSNSNSALSTSTLTALKETANALFATDRTDQKYATTIDNLPVNSEYVSLAVFNELQADEANLKARLLAEQNMVAPDLISNPVTVFEAQQKQMHHTAFGYGLRIMPDSSLAHCSEKVALLSSEFGSCTPWSRLTGQPHEIISVFDSSALPTQAVTRFDLEPKATLVPALKPAYA